MPPGTRTVSERGTVRKPPAYASPGVQIKFRRRGTFQIFNPPFADVVRASPWLTVAMFEKRPRTERGQYRWRGDGLAPPAPRTVSDLETIHDPPNSMSPSIQVRFSYV
jgi:hypothetical protein